MAAPPNARHVAALALVFLVLVAAALNVEAATWQLRGAGGQLEGPEESHVAAHGRALLTVKKPPKVKCVKGGPPKKNKLCPDPKYPRVCCDSAGYVVCVAKGVMCLKPPA